MLFGDPDRDLDSASNYEAAIVYYVGALPVQEANVRWTIIFCRVVELSKDLIWLPPFLMKIASYRLACKSHSLLVWL